MTRDVEYLLQFVRGAAAGKQGRGREALRNE